MQDEKAITGIYFVPIIHTANCIYLCAWHHVQRSIIMSSRRDRQTSLGIVGVIIVGLLVCIAYFFAMILVVEDAKGATVPPAQRVTLPMKCRPLLGQQNDAWIDCMGVGYR